MSASIAAAWDARVAHLLTKLPDRADQPSSGCVIRHGDGRGCSPLSLIAGGIFSILPVLGLWMLPLGLALMSDDVPWLKTPLDARPADRAGVAQGPRGLAAPCSSAISAASPAVAACRCSAAAQTRRHSRRFLTAREDG